jgi:hypothetical protein
MKTIVLGLLILISASVMASGSHHSSGGSTHWTSGHVTRNGTYVSGHTSTNPNHTRYDNYSTRGNFNPYTGKSGTVGRSSKATLSGPNGGQYYYNSRGKKTYVSH